MSHTNPNGYLEYRGKYTVYLIIGAPTNHLPRRMRTTGSVITVGNGRIKQVMGGIQFHADDEPFSWSYRYIREIRDGNGKLIWQNRDYR